LVVLLSGASLIELVKSALLMTLLSSLLGRPYGIYLDYLKKIFGINKKK
jgi:hypothetical protein